MSTVYGYGYGHGTVLGTGIRVGIPGEYPASSPPMPEESACPSGAGPGRPAGPGVGGDWCSDVTVGGDGRYHPSGPVGRAQALPPCTSLAGAHLGPITSELTSFSIKLVKTGKCHRKVCKRPAIVPISKTALKSHLLIFLDFHFGQPSLTRN